jgi:hypothetical protein
MHENERKGTKETFKSNIKVFVYIYFTHFMMIQDDLKGTVNHLYHHYMHFFDSITFYIYRIFIENYIPKIPRND